jgi:hypothetical protein
MRRRCIDARLRCIGRPALLLIGLALFNLALVVLFAAGAHFYIQVQP